MKEKIIIICGPTAVGKSAVAVKLAKRFGGEIVSADSRQVYRGMDIGTGKITKEERQGIRHHMIDIASPRRTYTAARFVRDADRAIRGIVRRKKLPIVCGGTGFYSDALLRRIVPAPVPPNAKLRRALSVFSPDILFEKLRSQDPERARTIDPHNKVRLIRALEIVDALGAVPPRPKGRSPYLALSIGITLPREILRARIAERLCRRLDQGLVEEVERLRKEGLSDRRLGLLGLEYRETLRYLTGEGPRATFVERLTTAICQYAKRQLTWFRADRDLHWMLPSQTDEMEQLVSAFLSHH